MKILKFPVLAIILALSVVTIAGCSKEPTVTTANQIIKKISVAEANTLIQTYAGKADFVLLDVRTPAEFAAGHLEGAIMIDFNAGNFRAEAEKLDINKRYLVYCRTDNRSGQAVTIMKDLGFKEIYDMDGGITEWQAAGYPVVK
jgi:rhodanese-related sulfurtransferase